MAFYTMVNRKDRFTRRHSMSDRPLQRGVSDTTGRLPRGCDLGTPHLRANTGRFAVWRGREDLGIGTIFFPNPDADISVPRLQLRKLSLPLYPCGCLWTGSVTILLHAPYEIGRFRAGCAKGRFYNPDCVGPKDQARKFVVKPFIEDA